MSALSVSFINYSKVDWTRDFYGYVYQEVLSNPGVTPGPTLQAMSGKQSMSIDQMLSTLDQGPLEIFCCWRSPDGYRIGVRLVATFQMFGMGYRPTWFVMSDQLSPNTHPNWVQSADDPSTPYTWSGIPFSVVSTPDSEHMSLSLSVQIGDVRHG
ncbi:MAG: hypothetical protein ACKVOJ_13600 [Sphingomonadaceae bacterium]